jgi:hypothetical protein
MRLMRSLPPEAGCDPRRCVQGAIASTQDQSIGDGKLEVVILLMLKCRR